MACLSSNNDMLMGIGHTIHVPIKSFVAFSFKHWLCGMLACSGFKKMMDKAWVPCKEVLVAKKADTSFHCVLITSILLVTSRQGRS